MGKAFLLTINWKYPDSLGVCYQDRLVYAPDFETAKQKLIHAMGFDEPDSKATVEGIYNFTVE